MNRLKELLNTSNAIMDIRLTFPDVKFNFLIEKAGEMVYKNLHTSLIFNPRVYNKNIKRFLQDTVPHELAHYIIFSQCPGAEEHGEEWCWLMENIFNAPLNVEYAESMNIKENYYVANTKIA